MNRRDFLEKLPYLATPFLLGGVPINLLAESSSLFRLAASNPDSDRVLVLIQMHGGNDGLNTVIPMDQYTLYRALRKQIYIPEPSTGSARGYIDLDSTLPDEARVGLHPDMGPMKALYDQGKVAIVQGVAYENLNQSHFRSRDIWFMGGDYDDYLGSGWAGRYLDTMYPNYPNDYPNPNMLDPLAIEVGNGFSLGFHRDTGVPTSIAINDPEGFFNLITNTGIEPPAELANTYYGDELRYILDIDKQSDKYANRLKAVYQKGSNTVTYPTNYSSTAPSAYARNDLAPQLKMIARLLSGGCKTRVFLVQISKFDTHANQVEIGDTTIGRHAALLHNMSAAMKAFQDDLKGLGLEDRVMSVTFSEFGRRAEGNGSYGTDHGTSAPMFVFGKCVKPGVVGTNPDLSNLDNGNLRQQHDYRQVFTTLIHDWMGAPADALKATRFDAWVDKKLPIVSCKSDSVGLNKEFFDQRYHLNSCYPNPASQKVTFSFYLNGEKNASLFLFDAMGNKVKTILNEPVTIGEHKVEMDVSDLLPGTYIYTLEAGELKTSNTLVILR